MDSPCYGLLRFFGPTHAWHIIGSQWRDILEVTLVNESVSQSVRESFDNILKFRFNVRMIKIERVIKNS